ncbi:MAG TPA: FRG domain-containing protein [Caulobacteraceae bacterium]
MERVGAHAIWSFVDGHAKIQKVSNTQVRKGLGYWTPDYITLAAKIAELQFRNRDHVLLFRGQRSDYRTSKQLSTIRPGLFRPLPGKLTVGSATIAKRFKQLDIAEARLTAGFKALNRLGMSRVARQRLLRWAILQHYEVCETPLLDVTHSLRIAASFASKDCRDTAYLYVLAVPNISGSVTASAEAGLQIVRLSSVCPPSALRPHIQEGYLLGEYPDMTGPAQKEHYKTYEVDFGRRLIGKFRFRPSTFWTNGPFPEIDHEALYPPSKDWLQDLTRRIREELASASER